MRFDLKTFLKTRNDPKLLLKPLVDQFMLTSDLSYFDDDDIALIERLVRKWQVARKGGVFSPSGALRCLREQTISANGYTGLGVEDPYTLNLFDDGNWRHIRWHTIFHRMAKQGLLRAIAIEEPVIYKPWGVYGTPDDILEVDKEDGPVRFIVDVKGTHDAKFKEIAQTGKALDGHEWQLHGYFQARGLNVGVIWYENKNDQSYTEIRVRRSIKIVRTLRYRYKSAKLHRQRGTLPEHECTMQSSDLKFRRCPQRLNCLKLTKEGK